MNTILHDALMALALALCLALTGCTVAIYATCGTNKEFSVSVDSVHDVQPGMDAAEEAAGAIGRAAIGAGAL